VARHRQRLTYRPRATSDGRIESRNPWQEYVYRQTTGYGASFNRSLSEYRCNQAGETAAHKPEQRLWVTGHDGRRTGPVLAGLFASQMSPRVAPDASSACEPERECLIPPSPASREQSYCGRTMVSKT
jgi:hypothetical protein